MGRSFLFEICSKSSSGFDPLRVRPFFQMARDFLVDLFGRLVSIRHLFDESLRLAGDSVFHDAAQTNFRLFQPQIDNGPAFEAHPKLTTVRLAPCPTVILGDG